MPLLTVNFRLRHCCLDGAVLHLAWRCPPGSEYASTSVAVGEPVTFVYSSSHDVWQFADFAAYQACDFGRAITLGGRTALPPWRLSFLLRGVTPTTCAVCDFAEVVSASC